MCPGYKLRLTLDTQVIPFLGPVMASGPIILGKVLLSATTFDALNSHVLLFSRGWSELWMSPPSPSQSLLCSLVDTSCSPALKTLSVVAGR